MSEERATTVASDGAGDSLKTEAPTISMWPEPWGTVARNFQQHCDDGDTLDIYQMCSFMAHNCDSNCKRYFYYTKALCCALFQTAGLIIFIWNAIKETDKPLCAGDGDWDVRVIATIATMYISLTMGSMVTVLDNQGLYEFDGWSGSDVPPFISFKWLFFGATVNYFTLMCAIWGSFVVIYSSESALDVVLNAVALFFALEIDDLMIDEYDYERITDWFERKYNATDYPQPVVLTKCQLTCVKGIGLAIVISVFIAMLGAMAAPFYIAICF